MPLSRTLRLSKVFGVYFFEAVRVGLRPSLGDSGELSAMPSLSDRCNCVLLPCVPVGWMWTVRPLVLVLVLAITLVESQPGSLLL